MEVVSLFVLLDESHGDTVKITTTVLGDSATTIEPSSQRKEFFLEGYKIRETIIEKVIQLKRTNLPLGVLFQDIDLLKGLEDLALDTATGIDVVAGAGTAIDTATVELSEGTYTNAGAKIDVTGDRSCKPET